ncbi:hypothetical protein [Bacillus cereus]|uniref:hypothetical protein n=1 Tax=Bacillus cereus TaxID=1396 RepID=UPI000BF92E40|nr:hypothetical protein [Bacillus cereus]PFA76830.1 hypothetical protein CN406_17395 [Bacillus cereus]
MRIYALILVRDVVLITDNAKDLFDRNIKNDEYIGREFYTWRRIDVWQDGKQIKTITISGNKLVDMPQSTEEVWEAMIN